MSKPKKNSVKSQSGDPFTRWLVIGMVTLVVVVGAGFSLLSENKAKDAAFTALDSFQSLGTLPATVDPAEGDGIVFNAGLPIKIDIFEDFQCPVCKLFEDPIGGYLTSLVTEKKAQVTYHPLSFLGNGSKDDESIAAKSVELFKVADADCTIAHDDIHILGEYLEEFLEPLYPLFERINFPYGGDAKFWKEIRAYLEFKERNNFNPPL